MRAWTLVVALAGSLLGCFGDPDPNPNRPTAPAENDPAFTTDGLRHWYLLGDGARPAMDQVTAYITAPSGTDFVDAYIPDLPPIRMHGQDGGFAMDVSIASLGVGAHEVLFSANGSNTAFAKWTLNRSAAYYVLVSTDYDFSEPGTTSIDLMDALHRDHPGLVITHFWPPYTYTDPMVTPERRDELDVWIKKQRDELHDEIALHIHPWCNFVETAGITCITDQSTVYPAGDTTGYTIKLSAYEREPMGKLLQQAATIFGQRGLGTPKTFRAGGWTADANTLLALADNGYVADTSALNWTYIKEEWPNSELLNWNMTHWATIGDTTQPYYPSISDPLVSTPGSNINLLEVPDNGVMIDYVSLEQMNAIFDANWDGAPFAGPRTLMMGFHPSESFGLSQWRRVHGFLDYADMHSSNRDLGPVVYITLSDVTLAFPGQ
ncbi:MAG: hypothetical protein HOV81_36785 [Kofleriaceae bacterium]|nr:hypothetical protein [Kofleriaceae bacterium]